MKTILQFALFGTGTILILAAVNPDGVRIGNRRLNIKLDYLP